MTQDTGTASFWHRLLDTRLTRRSALGGAAATAAAITLPLTISEAEAVNNGGPSTVDPRTVKPQTVAPFRAIPSGNADALTLPAGFRYQVLAPWGEVFTDAGREIGFNHDYVGFFQIGRAHV